MAKKRRKRKKKRRSKKRSISDFSNPLHYNVRDATSNDPKLHLTVSTCNDTSHITIRELHETRKNRKLNVALKLVSLISDGILSKIAALILRALLEKVSVAKRCSYLKKLESFLVTLNKDIAENRTKRFLS